MSNSTLKWDVKKIYTATTQSFNTIIYYYLLSSAFETNFRLSKPLLLKLLNLINMSAKIKNQKTTDTIFLNNASRFVKKSYVQKNYIIKHASNVSSIISTSRINYLKNSEILFRQWIKLNSSMPSTLNQLLKSPNQNLILPLLKSSECFNVKALFTRWINTFHLLHTLLVYKSSLTIFSNPMFIEEVSSLNFNNNEFNYNLFRFVQPCFFFQEPSYGLNSLLVFTKLLKHRLDVSIITDINLHENTLFYLQSINSYTIGLVPGNYNQWTFSYPIPTTLESFVSQYFFLKWFYLTKQLATRETTTQMTYLWQQTTNL